MRRLPGARRLVDAEWDAELRAAMEAQGEAVEEEAVIDDQMADLEASAMLR